MKSFVSYIRSCIKEPDIRMNIGLLFGLVFNGSYIVFNTVFGIIRSDAWFVGASAYYLLMLVMRYSVFDGESISAHELGLLMLILSFPMSGMIFYKIFKTGSPTVPGAFRGIFGLYFIYSAVRVALPLRSIKRNGGSELSLNIVRLTSALFSFFSLWITAAPGLGISAGAERILNVVIGGAVSLTVLAISFFMVINRRF